MNFHCWFIEKRYTVSSSAKEKTLKVVFFSVIFKASSKMIAVEWIAYNDVTLGKI